MRISSKNIEVDWMEDNISLNGPILWMIDEECAESALCLARTALRNPYWVGKHIAETLSIMGAIVSDSSRSEEARIACAFSIGLTGYMSADDIDLIYKCIETLKRVWSSPELSKLPMLFSTSLSAWALLLKKSPRGLRDALDDHQTLIAYLEKGRIAARVACGKVIALIYELAREWRCDEEYVFPNHKHILEMVKDSLSKSIKITWKKDRPKQRADCREIHSFFMDNEVLVEKIEFGEEILELDSIFKKLLYSQCCQLLRNGMEIQLKDNRHLRTRLGLKRSPTVKFLVEIVEKRSKVLGEKDEDDEILWQDKKNRKKLQQKAYDIKTKINKQSRGYQRDQRQQDLTHLNF